MPGDKMPREEMNFGTLFVAGQQHSYLAAMVNCDLSGIGNMEASTAVTVNEALITE